ncbi:MAG: DMT family transporter [Ekhidna sp.]
MVKYKIPIFAELPPQVCFIVSAIFHYLGPSFAVLLFQQVPVSGVAWLRIVSAAVIFAIWKRPWKFWSSFSRPTKVLIALLGLDFALMNYSFYYAIDALPLGLVSAIEFIGPTILALIGSKSIRNLLTAIIAIIGVYLITDIRIVSEPIGVFWAFINALLFLIYIILANRVAKISHDKVKSIDKLAVAMLIAGLFITPLGLEGALPAFDNSTLLFAGIGVGISSSLIPYVFDQLALQKTSKATYSIMVSILPAMAVVIGFVVLNQIPSLIEIAAVFLIIIAVLFTRSE